MTREARESARERMREAFGGIDFVSREEFEIQRDMLGHARMKLIELEERVSALERELHEARSSGQAD